MTFKILLNSRALLILSQTFIESIAVTALDKRIIRCLSLYYKLWSALNIFFLIFNVTLVYDFAAFVNSAAA